ncbi:MAG: hypothetical protein ISQ26_09795 [Candidatus Puniceispirillum sp.]|nr:hypothetical protein [Candidatus Puniceispirillum sp.]
MSDEQTTAEVTEATEQATAEAAQAPDLTVTDLQALKSIIDVASQRGAFKPNEMMTVGQTYNKLDAFLVAVTANQQPPQGV